MKIIKLIKVLLICLVCGGFQFTAAAQQTPPHWTEIQQFKKQDSISMPPKNGILFLGSSSIRMWKDAETTFKEYKVINRGFGGSTIADAIEYLDYLVYPYQARQIVIYSGENDIASGTSAEETFNRFKTLVTRIRAHQPKVSLLYLSMKESPSRQQFRDTLLKANDLIKSYLNTVDKAEYLDINALMLDKDGNTRPELFQNDMLHMKKSGYDIWEKAVQPHLLKP